MLIAVNYHGGVIDFQRGTSHVVQLITLRKAKTYIHRWGQTKSDMNGVERVWDLIEKFRRTEHYLDVIWQDIRRVLFKPKLERLADMDENEFKKLMLSELFMRPRLGEAHIDKILSENDFREIKIRLMNLLFGRGPLEDRLRAVIELKHVGPYIASQFLSLISDDYIIYHEKVLDGIRSLLPELAKWLGLPERVRTAEEYIHFNTICAIIKEYFGFRSLGEVHEFFWHGHDQGWF